MQCLCAQRVVRLFQGKFAGCSVSSITHTATVAPDSVDARLQFQLLRGPPTFIAAPLSVIHQDV